MFRSNWSDGLAPFLVAVLIVWTVIATVLVLERYDGKPCPANPEACEQYEKSKKVGPFRSQLETNQTDQKSYREEYRAEQDLIAQQNMASWTWWMMLASWISLIALGAAAYFAWLAAHWAKEAAIAADKTAAATDEIGKSQLRAYVVIKGGFVKAVPLNDNLWRVHCEVELINAGVTPGYDFRTISEAGWYQVGTPMPDATLDKVDTASSIIGPGQCATVARDDIVSKEVIEGFRNGTWQLVYAGRATYVDIHGTERHFDWQCCLGRMVEEFGWAIGRTHRGYWAN